MEGSQINASLQQSSCTTQLTTADWKVSTLGATRFPLSFFFLFFSSPIQKVYEDVYLTEDKLPPDALWIYRSLLGEIWSFL